MFSYRVPANTELPELHLAQWDVLSDHWKQRKEWRQLCLLQEEHVQSGWHIKVKDHSNIRHLTNKAIYVHK